MYITYYLEEQYYKELTFRLILFARLNPFQNGLKPPQERQVLIILHIPVFHCTHTNEDIVRHGYTARGHVQQWLGKMVRESYIQGSMN